MRIIIISGMSGSGKSTAVKALEDEGFFCIDNLPVQLFKTFVNLVRKSRDDSPGIVLVMDIRGRDFIKGYHAVLQDLRAAHQVEVIFFDASDEVLIRRFSETRRRHPALETASVAEGIAYEREQLAGLRALADLTIDTSDFNVHQLRDFIGSMTKKDGEGRELTVHVQSFGFRYGLPMDSDMVLDVRFLPNPHFVPELQPFSGQDERVRSYVTQQPETVRFFDHLKELVLFLLPLFGREGKSYLTISIGCTGGRHRSVVLVEALHEFLALQGMKLKVTHRDMEKK